LLSSVGIVLGAGLIGGVVVTGACAEVVVRFCPAVEPVTDCPAVVAGIVLVDEEPEPLEVWASAAPAMKLTTSASSCARTCYLRSKGSGAVSFDRAR
jgi:hypothetical protein